MLIQDVHLRIKTILNKIDSQDYDNIEAWQINAAFNAAQLSWTRRNLHGYNYFMEGDESSKIRIDDFQVLLKYKDMNLIKNEKCYITHDIPDDYLLFKRIDIKATKGCCSKADMVCYFAEQGNLHLLLNDYLRKPSFEWRETFFTMRDNKIEIWTNDEFEIDNAKLMYYSIPPYVEMNGVYSTYTGTISTQDVHPIFKDDIVELIIHEAAKLIAGNIESINQIQINTSNVEQNN